MTCSRMTWQHEHSWMRMIRRVRNVGRHGLFLHLLPEARCRLPSEIVVLTVMLQTQVTLSAWGAQRAPEGVLRLLAVRWCHSRLVSGVPWAASPWPAGSIVPAGLWQQQRLARLCFSEVSLEVPRLGMDYRYCPHTGGLHKELGRSPLCRWSSHLHLHRIADGVWQHCTHWQSPSPSGQQQRPGQRHTASRASRRN